MEVKIDCVKDLRVFVSDTLPCCLSVLELEERKVYASEVEIKKEELSFVSSG